MLSLVTPVSKVCLFLQQSRWWTLDLAGQSQGVKAAPCRLSRDSGTRFSITRWPLGHSWLPGPWSCLSMGSHTHSLNKHAPAPSAAGLSAKHGGPHAVEDSAAALDVCALFLGISGCLSESLQSHWDPCEPSWPPCCPVSSSDISHVVFALNLLPGVSSLTATNYFLVSLFLFSPTQRGHGLLFILSCYSLLFIQKRK